MKHLSKFVLLLMLTVVFSCNEKAADKDVADGNGGKSNDMLKTNREMYKAFETGDSVTISKHISSDAVDHNGGPNGEDVKGNDIVKMLSSVHNDIDNLKFEVLEEAASDDHIFALVHMTGTTNKPVWGMPANHKVDNRSIDLIKVNNGKLSDHWGFFEMAEMMKMMGGGKPEGGAAKDSAR